MPRPKQTTMVSRSFGAEVRDYDELANAIAMFANDAARSLRRANLVSTSVSVFIETNRFGKSLHYAPSELLSKVVYGFVMRRRDPGVLHSRI